MTRGEDQHQQSKSPPLFEFVQPELIKMEGVEDKATKLLETTPMQTGILITLYLIVVVSDGEVTIPLAVALPEIIADLSNVSFWYVVPALLGVLGLFLLCYRFRKVPKSRNELRITNFGLSLMLVSSYLFVQSSESPVVSFLGVMVFLGYYLFLLQRQTNKKQGSF